MKYFSLEFNLKKQDYDAYYREFGKGLFVNQVKRSAITLVLMAVMAGIYFSMETAGFLATVLFVGALVVVMPLAYAKKLSTSLLQAKSNMKANRYDFFADHIEIHIDPDENSKASTEKHLKMNGFVSVAESKTNFYFSYMNERILIIPKRVLDNEKYGMIKNLIDNYFSGVYITV